MGQISRRRFGQWLGAGVLAGSFLRGLAPRARAAGEGVAKRLVIFFSPNGTIHQHWRPTGTGGADFHFAPGSILEPLSGRKQGLLVLDGIDFKGTSNHEGGMSHMLTGGGTAANVGGGASIDQFVAGQIGGGVPFGSLELGVQTSAWGGNVQTRMSYAAPGIYVPPDDSPASVYQRLSGAVSPEADAGPTPKDLRRQSVIDVVKGELNVLRTSVGQEEKLKLDQHLAAVYELEVALASKGFCAEVDVPGAVDPYDNDSFPEVGRAQIDLLVTALACGMTRVATLQMSHTVGPPVFSWLGIGEGHHSLSHVDDANAAGVQDFVKAERWFSGEFDWLLSRLEATPDMEYGGTLLDNTLVVWAQEMGDGRLHECVSVPFVLAGAGEVLDLGRYVHCGGAPHQKLLVSICHALGVDVVSYGDPSHGTGPLGGLI